MKRDTPVYVYMYVCRERFSNIVCAYRERDTPVFAYVYVYIVYIYVYIAHLYV